jgi:secreted PhoX family phosphatase
VAKKPSIQRIKKEKRDQPLEPAPAGMTRRRFLTFLGTGSAALAAGSTGVLVGCSEGQEGANQQGSQNGEAAQAPAGGGGPSFRPIEPTDKDDLVLPEGFGYEIIRSSGDPLGGGLTYGDHNDFVAYFPIDALEGGDNSEDGILWVNHEYINPMFWSDYTDTEGATRKTKEQISREKAGVGGSIIRVKKEGDSWRFVENDELNRRIDATTPMGATGPAAGSPEMQMEGKSEVIGTFANCSGGVTPWNTVLSCEENYQDYYGENSPKRNQSASDDESAEDGEGEEDIEKLDVADTYRWLDDPATAQPPESYGYVVEVDPFDPDSKPRKHSWLGRVRHENVAMTFTKDGRVVAYTGHDQEDECIYKFISSGKYDPDDRKANMELLTDGMLYVANFANGEWIPMDFENNPVFKANGYKDQADVLVRTAEAAKLAPEDSSDPIGTPLDRCEDIEVDPKDGRVYAALTNNAKHGNFYGQVIRITELDDDAASTEFRYEVFAAGGPNTGFASPDNLSFDNYNNLWVVTDISSSRLNDGIYETFKNNGAFVMPSVADDHVGSAYQFASGPVECELTGPFFTPDYKTLFLAIQHPGEETEDVNEPTSTWPRGDIPRPAVVAITGFPGGPGALPGLGGGGLRALGGGGMAGWRASELRRR